MRLRPTLIIFEDLHLIQDPHQTDLKSIIDALSDEAVSLLFVARHISSAIEGSIEGSSLERCSLEGLSGEEVKELWQRLFQTEPCKEILQLLIDATKGNPLAIRSALRGGVAAKLITQDEKGGFALTASLEQFEKRTRQTASRIGEGMAAVLDDEERSAAETLALLGEVFARESADQLLGKGNSSVDRLIFRGILRLLPTAHTPLCGTNREQANYPQSDLPLLGFTHQLIHQHFFLSSRADRNLLVSLIAHDLPLYSKTPVVEYVGHLKEGIDKTVDVALLYLAFVRASLILYDQLLSTEWQEAEPMLLAMKKGVEMVEEHIEEDQRNDLKLTLLFREAVLAGLKGEKEREIELIEEAKKQTDPPTTETLARLRLGAIIKDPNRDWYDADERKEGLYEGEKLEKQFPQLRFHPEYARFVCAMGIYAWEAGDVQTARHVEKYYQELCEKKANNSLLKEIQVWFLPVLAQIYESEEELAYRKEQLATLDDVRSTGVFGTHLAELRMRFYFDTGQVDRLLRTVGESLEMVRLRVMHEVEARGEGRRLFMYMAVGVGENAVERYAQEISERRLEQGTLRQTLWHYIVSGCWLSGEEKWKEVAKTRGVKRELNSLLRILLEKRQLNEQERGKVREALSRPLLRIDDLISTTAAIALLGKPEDQNGKEQRAIADALLRCHRWLKQQNMPGFLSPLIESAKGHIDPKELKRWKKDLDNLRNTRQGLLGRIVGDGRVRVKVIGSIECRDRSGEHHRISGARMKIVLGLMVANHIGGGDLSLDEFALLAAGDELADVEGARNNLYVRLHSLRKLFGPHAIITEKGQSPQLATEHVHVDLLEAGHCLEVADKGLRREAVGRALDSVLSLLEIIGNDILFPGLFDNFFDAVRDDFEVALRDMVLRIVRETSRLGDHESTVLLLDRVVQRTPDDEELVDYISDALSALGRRSQAERIKLRMKIEG